MHVLFEVVEIQPDLFQVGVDFLGEPFERGLGLEDRNFLILLSLLR
jgi:hypothetical protein